MWDVPADTAGAPTFVLVHGLGVSSRYFTELTDSLTGHGRILVVDLPGFGGVPRPSDPMRMGDFASLVIKALDELDPSSPEQHPLVLIGHSMGTQVCIEIARKRPDLGGRVVLVSPVVAAARRSLPRVAGAFLRSSLHERPGAAMVSIRAYFEAGLRWMFKVLPSMIGYPIEERIRTLRGRLIIVVGEEDRLSPVEWCEGLIETSGATGHVVVVPGAAHQVVVDDADPVAEAALALLEEGSE